MEGPKCGAMLGYCTGCKLCDLSQPFTQGNKMTNQMPERIWAYKTSGRNANHFKEIKPRDSHHYTYVTEYVKADLAQKTVTREELAVLVWETLNFYFDPKDVGGSVADALIAAGVVKVTDEK